MVGFARECAREFAAYGIRVNSVLVDPLPPDATDEQLDRRARDCAAAVLSFCSAERKNVMGTTLAISDRD